MDHELLAGHLQELRRGTVVLASLAALRTELYGYRLIEVLGEAGIEVGADTLYPLLRRLESQGLLESAWNTDEARPRKFYITTESGRAILESLWSEWQSLNESLTRIVNNVEAP